MQSPGLAAPRCLHPSHVRRCIISNEVICRRLGRAGEWGARAQGPKGSESPRVASHAPALQVAGWGWDLQSQASSQAAPAQPAALAVTSGRLGGATRPSLPSMTWMWQGRSPGSHFSSSSAHTSRRLAGATTSSGHSSCTGYKGASQTKGSREQRSRATGPRWIL